ncbi:unnamed protein product [Prunus armeniaca]|uniref:Uncharacterized protein n=1 Tax=Prunus armeniaca TaxID=36596 RepID=A0A6J5W4Q0_PRUAR|nr:unnamed protein product [Prunus armeniaca]
MALHRIQEARDLLCVVGVSVDDKDIVILALNGYQQPTVAKFPIWPAPNIKVSVEKEANESSFLESASSVFSSETFLMVSRNTDLGPPRHIFGLDEFFLAPSMARLQSTNTLSDFYIDSTATLCALKGFVVLANGDDTY